MQTFLPYASYSASAKVLDPSRLGNQVYREGLTLFRGGWPNHPAAKMWAGHRFHLGLYCLACLIELNRRGKYYEKWFNYFNTELTEEIDTGPPAWLGYEAFHLSHQSNLVRKKPDWYRPIFIGVPDDLPYVWPNP